MTRVYLEVTKRRTFAMALDWPGWGRSGKTADTALATLAEYAPRYAVVADKAKVGFPASAGDELVVVEELPGNMTTEFGAPAMFASADAQPWAGAEASRAAALLQGSWDVLAQVAAASPEQLRKGPRGGGRDRDAIIDHVVGAEAMYARKIGLKHRRPAPGDQAAVHAMREDILELLRADSDGGPVVPKGWPVRYAARRITWHVLDHAWEIQDRGPG